MSFDMNGKRGRGGTADGVGGYASMVAVADDAAAAILGGHDNSVADTRRKTTTTPRLHDAYEGGNQLMANTIIDLLATSDISFVTDILLPMLYHANPNIKWRQEWEENGLMEREQDGGVAPLKASGSQQFSAWMQRFGKAIVFSDGFCNTEAGRGLFRLRIAHMVKEIGRTLDIRGLIAIMGAHSHHFALFNNLPDTYREGGAVNPLDCFERELATFAILQREERALYTLDERMRTALESQGANPNAWLILTEAMSHCAMEDAEVEYYRAGRDGRANLKHGKHALTTFRNTPVYPVKDYEVYGRVINPLKRTRVIGDFWAVRDFGYGQLEHDTCKRDPSTRCQTDVYCCGTDAFMNFSLDELHKGVAEHVDMEHVGHDVRYVNARDGETEDMLNERLLMLESPLLMYQVGQGGDYELVYARQGALSSTDVLTWLKKLQAQKRYPVDVELPDQITHHAWDASISFPKRWTLFLRALKESNQDFETHRLPYPLSVMCYRPFRRYKMGSAVLMEGGRNTGITAYAHNDVQIGNDAQSKQTLVHFTGNFASVILDGRRVAIAPDVYCCGYEGGEGHRTVDPVAFTDFSGCPMEYGKKYPGHDVFVVPGPCLAAANIDGLEFTQCAAPVDITGKYRQCIVDGGNSTTPGSLMMQMLYNMGNAMELESPDVADFMAHEQVFHSDEALNSTCFPATQKVPNLDGLNQNFIRGCGHFGDFIGPGSRAARNGLSNNFTKMEFEKMFMREA